MTLRVVELFSGIGAQRMALMQAGIPHEVVAICEINRHALASYQAIYGDCPNLGDITKVQALPPCDLVTYSFPCFVGSTPVRTPKGDIPIKDIRRGDLVATDDGWHLVLAQAMTGIHPVVTVALADGRSVRCTPDHRIMAWAQGFVRPEWMPARMLTREHLCKVWIDGLGWSWMPVESVSEPGDPVEVYDIEVEVAHCFLARGILAHNCQDLSLAGKRKGMGEGTRSGLVWEVVRLIKSCEERERPEWLLMENVPQVLTSPLWPDLPPSTDAPARCIRDIMEPQVGERYIRRIPLDRVKWREPLAGYRHPQSEGLDMPLLDAGDPRLETRRIAAEDSLAPTLRCGVPVRVVSEEEEERAKQVCERADNVRMAPKGEKSIGTATQDGVRLAVSPEEQRRQAQGITAYNPDADIKVFGCRDDNGDIDQNANPCKTFRNRRYYLDDGKAPACCLHTKEIPIIDYIEAPGIKVVADRQRKGIEMANRLYDPDHASPGLMTHGGGDHHVKVADHVETTSTPVASIDGETFYSRKMLYSSSSCPTIRTFHSGKDMVKVVDGADPLHGDLVVRVLTPLECWRLMGFPDWAYDRASKVSSETQLYNQAGNSIVVQVLVAIFKAMQERPKGGQATLERWGA